MSDDDDTSWLTFAGSFIDNKPLYRLSDDVLRTLGEACALTDRRSVMGLAAWKCWRDDLLAHLNVYRR